MRTLMLSVLFLFVSGFGACSTAPKNSQEAVYAIEGAYSVALTVAIEYKNLPKCAPGAGPLCSDVAVLEKLRLADDTARPVILAARKIVCTAETTEGGKRVCKSAFDEGAIKGSIAAAEAALKAFTDITASLPRK